MSPEIPPTDPPAHPTPHPNGGADWTATLSLVQRAQAGDDAARERLFARYLPRVRGLVALRSGHSLDAFLEHDDLVQEALLDAFRHLDDFDANADASTNEGCFVRWMARIVESRIKDGWRRQRADKRGAGRAPRLADLGETTVARHERASEETSPPSGAAARERAAALETALLQLSERYREVVYHRMVLDLPWAEVAAAMELKNGETARALHHKATARLAALLGRSGPDDHR